MTSTQSHPISARLGAARFIRRTAVALSIATVGVLSTGSGAQASSENVLADEINASADSAVRAFETFAETDLLGDYLVYAEHRTATARLAARELGYNEFALVDAWKNTTLDHQRAVLAAMTQVGVPYRTNASVEGEGFDCSGLTSYAWEESGTELFRQSGSQIGAAEQLSMADAKAGDLAYYPGHVMLYLGVDDAVVHSVKTGRTVEVDTISESRLNSVTFGDPTE